MSDCFDKILDASGKRLSSEQMEAVNSKIATVVSAGAGSGKTTVLSFRFLRLVLDGVDADRILTLTFTKKAAAEMYERIYKLLSLAARESGDSRLLLQLKEKFPLSHISTMDSFWTEIARTNSLKYGVARDFSIMSSEDVEDIAHRILERLAEEDSLSQSYMDIASAYDSSQLNKIFVNLAYHIDILTEYSLEDAKSGFIDFIAILKRKWGSPKRVRAILEQIDSYREYAKSGGLYDKNGDLEKAFHALDEESYEDLPQFNKIKHSTTVHWNEVKALIDEYRAAKERLIEIAELEKDIEEDLKLSELFVSFVSEFNKEKRKNSLLTFLDVQSLAKRILLDDKKVRAYYKKKFDYIMVDEFQDNNNEQKELLYLLSEQVEFDGDGIPTAFELDNRKLFFVGDDKQSIYRFRGADVSVFNALKDEVVNKMNGLSLSLGTNYRSEEKLVNHFNKVFSMVFLPTDEASIEDSIVEEFTAIPNGSYNASAADIKAGRTASISEPILELAIIDEKQEDDEPNDFLSKEESEAEYIADRILMMLKDPIFMIPEKNGSRHPVFEDIGVLYSKTKSQMLIERALRQRGIPYTVVESTSVTLEGIAYDFYSFLQLLIYPEDKKSYMEVLLSPFARISNDGMSFLLDNEKEFKAFDEVPEFSEKEDRESFISLKALYDDCMETVGREKITKTLERIYYTSGYRTYLLSKAYLSVYDEHFSYLWSIANNIDSEGGNLIDFLDYIRPLIGGAEKLSNVEIQRLGSSGVRLMTIHKSKGLEFPIVILAGSGTRERNLESKNNIVDTFHNGKQYLLYSKRMAKFFNAYNQRRINAEHKRVLYVALTRAINHLVITAVVHKKKNGELSEEASLYKLYREALEEEKISNIKEEHIQLYKEGEIRVDFDRVESPRDISWYEKAEVAKAPIWHDIKAGVKEISHEELDFDSLVDGEMLKEFPVEDILNRNKELRASFGTLVHSALEAIINGQELPPFHDSLLSEKEESRFIALAKDIAFSFKESDFYKKYLSSANGLLTEVRFFFPDKDVVLEGSADLLALCKDYNLVIDYKTDRHRNPDLHKGQITSYIKALTELYKKPCYGLVCYVRDFSSGPIWNINGEEVELY